MTGYDASAERNTILSGFLSLIFLYLFLVAPEPATADDEYQLEIIKSARELRIKRGNEIVKTFTIALGRGESGPKRRLGDNRTPTGFYRVLDFNGESQFYFFMQISYPNLLDAWHGYKDQIISSNEFKQIAVAFKDRRMPPQNTRLGGYIGIHGLGVNTDEKIHQSLNWTEGCIALSNDDMDTLRQFVTLGTPVFILN
jgi:murein L,D-transpeptidase YafK